MCRSRRIAVLLATALFAAGCSATADQTTPITSEPTTTVTTTSLAAAGPEWAAPITTYVDAFLAALDDGDDAGLFSFFATPVTFWPDTSSGATLIRAGGATQLLDAMDLLTGEHPAVRHDPMLFAAWAPPGEEGVEAGFIVFVVHTVSYPPATSCDGPTCEAVETLMLVGGHEGIGFLTNSRLTADIRLDPLALDPVPGDLEVILETVECEYADLATAMSAGEVQAMMGVEDGAEPGPADAAIVDAIVSGLEAGVATWPDARWVPVTVSDLGLRDTQDPAVFLIADADPSDLQEEHGAIGVYRIELEPGIVITVATRWVRRDGIVVSFDVVDELNDLDALARSLDFDPAEGIERWPETPTIERVATGTIVTDDGAEITLINAEPIQAELASWAIDRFEAAGIGVPHPRSIAFPPDVRCAVLAGVAIDTGDGIDLQLCTEVDEMCEGDPCRPSTVSRSVILHELGHVWTKEYTDDATRQAFLDLRRLEVWSEAGTERDALGSEHAAEILSWGLMDEPSWGARLPDSECGQLAEAFELLTGVAPLRTCD